MWWAVLRSVRPENNATAATASNTTTPAPVRGRVWLGARVEPSLAGAATCVPCALRVVGVVDALVVAVVAGGAAVATRGVFSHGGHGGA